MEIVSDEIAAANLKYTYWKLKHKNSHFHREKSLERRNSQVATYVEGVQQILTIAKRRCVVNDLLRGGKQCDQCAKVNGV